MVSVARIVAVRHQLERGQRHARRQRGAAQRPGPYQPQTSTVAPHERHQPEALHSGTCMPRPVASARRYARPAETTSSMARPSDLKSVTCSVVLPPRFRAARHLAQFGVNVVRADQALLDRQQDVARFLHRGGARIHHHERARHQPRIGLAVRRPAGADGDHVSARRDPGVVDHGRGRRGGQHHHVGVADRALGGIAGDDVAARPRIAAGAPRSDSRRGSRENRGPAGAPPDGCAPARRSR